MRNKIRKINVGFPPHKLYKNSLAIIFIHSAGSIRTYNLRSPLWGSVSYVLIER